MEYSPVMLSNMSYSVPGGPYNVSYPVRGGTWKATEAVIKGHDGHADPQAGPALPVESKRRAFQVRFARGLRRSWRRI